MKIELSAPLKLLTGSLDLNEVIEARFFSEKLSLYWLNELSQKKEFLEAHPILLGSWARGQICPHSDLDILFVGPEEKVQVLVEELFKKGVKIRSRVPQD